MMSAKRWMICCSLAALNIKLLGGAREMVDG